MGADIVTMPFSVILQMLKHPLTDLGNKKFIDDWNAVQGKK
jgi:transaldolase